MHGYRTAESVFMSLAMDKNQVFKVGLTRPTPAFSRRAAKHHTTSRLQCGLNNSSKSEIGTRCECAR
jgi:hypothetical protein